MPEQDDEREVARFYTRSRRFPKFIGRLHDGTKIIGGPYTLTQGAVLAITLIITLLTQGVWGTGTPLVDIPVALLVSWGGAWAAGKIPTTRRNMLSVIVGGMSAMARPSAGRYRGATVRIRQPRLIGGGTTIDAPETITLAGSLAGHPLRTQATEAIATPTPTPPPARTPALASNHPVSGVERLLLQARGAAK